MKPGDLILDPVIIDSCYRNNQHVFDNIIHNVIEEGKKYELVFSDINDSPDKKDDNNHCEIYLDDTNIVNSNKIIKLLESRKKYYKLDNIISKDESAHQCVVYNANSMYPLPPSDDVKVDKVDSDDGLKCLNELLELGKRPLSRKVNESSPENKKSRNATTENLNSLIQSIPINGYNTNEPTRTVVPLQPMPKKKKKVKRKRKNEVIDKRKFEELTNKIDRCVEVNNKLKEQIVELEKYKKEKEKKTKERPVQEKFSIDGGFSNTFFDIGKKVAEQKKNYDTLQEKFRAVQSKNDVLELKLIEHRRESSSLRVENDLLRKKVKELEEKDKSNYKKAKMEVASSLSRYVRLSLKQYAYNDNIL